MFQATCFNQDISEWDLGKNSDIGAMFKNDLVFNQPIGTWDTSLVSTATQTFSGATAFNQDISGWKFTSLSDAAGFLDLSGFSTANYDSLLNGILNQTPQVPYAVKLGASTVQYSSIGAAARTALTDKNGSFAWTLEDAGLLSDQVNPISPVITSWPSASNITIGQPLSMSSLSGGVVSGQVAGEFKFTIGTESTIPALGKQMVSVTFYPTDTVHYNSVTNSGLSIQVDKNVPAITWPTAVLSFGQSLLSAILSGSQVSTPGTFSLPDLILEVGTHLVQAIFNPTDAANYSQVSGQISVTVTKATPVIQSVPRATSISQGDALRASNLIGGQASVPGSFVFTSPNFVPQVGNSQVSITFSPSDTAHYNSVVLSISISVSSVDPVLPPTPEPSPTPTPSATPTPEPTTSVTPTPSESASPNLPQTLSKAATAIVDAVAQLAQVVLPKIQPGKPIANLAIGATGDDNSKPEPFNALSNEQTIKAVTQNAAAAVSIAVAAAGAAGAAGAVASAAVGVTSGIASGAMGGAGASGAGLGSTTSAPSVNSSASTSPSTSSSSGSRESNRFSDSQNNAHDKNGFKKSAWSLDGSTKNLGVDSGPSPGWGDRLRLFQLSLITFVDSPTMSLANKFGPRLPLVSKALLDGAYIRGMFGSFAYLLPIFNASLAVLSVFQNTNLNPGLVMSPPWLLFLIMVAISVLDAFSGLIGGIFYIGSSVLSVTLLGNANPTSFVLFIGVLLCLIGPAFLITGLRRLRRSPEFTFSYLWERLADLFIASFLAAWLVSSIVKSLPALAGHTLPVANHVQDLALAAAVAGLVRVVLEEFASRAFPRRLGWHSQIRVPTQSVKSKISSLFFKFLVWLLIAGSTFGFDWQIPVGTLLFLFPNILGLISDRLPNSPLIWKLMPSGFPGMTLSLIMSSASAAGLVLLVGSTPEMAKYSFLLMPIPLLIPGILKEFGRNGGPNGKKPSQSNKWVYRVGGIFVYLATLKLAGII
jgi:hypothetical protein